MRGTYVFKAATWMACYFFAFGLFFTISAWWETDMELRQASSVIVGILFSTVIVATGTFSIVDMGEDKPIQHDTLDGEFIEMAKFENNIFNLKNFFEWMKIYYPKKINSRGEDYLSHAAMEKIIFKYYENFENITDGKDYSLFYVTKHRNFIYDIKRSWLDGTYKSMI